MPRLLSAISWGLILAFALAGCARRCACVNGGGTSSAAVAPMPIETRAERGSIETDTTALASYEEVDRALGSPPSPTGYRVLRAVEVQCLAAANAPIAKLYDAESEAVLANSNRRGQRTVATLSRLMAYRAIDERNKAAAAALELFYSLAEAEANRDILQRSVEQIDRATANLEELKRSGLKMPDDQTALRRQKLDWIDRHIQLSSAIRKIQGQLQQLCGFEMDQTAPIWPEADLTVTVTPVEAEAAVLEGLANRADLGALQMLAGSPNADTLPAVRSGMQAFSPGLGASIAAKRLLSDRSADYGEARSRQSQLAQAQVNAELNVTWEIREAVWNIETRLREIAVAVERQEVWRQRGAALEEKRESNGVTAFDLAAARLELHRAESELVHRVIAWKIARVKLKQAQGLLAVECGYGLPGCCR